MTPGLCPWLQPPASPMTVPAVAPALPRTLLSIPLVPALLSVLLLLFCLPHTPPPPAPSHHSWHSLSVVTLRHQGLFISLLPCYHAAESFNHSVALAILRSSISVAYFTSFPEPLKLSEVVHFNLLTCIFWRRTTCSVEYAPLGSLQ